MDSPSVTRETFEQIVKRYSRPIFNVAYRIVNDYEDAMDITQTTFLKAYENMGSFDPSRRMFSWLCKICANEAINWIKRKRRSEPLPEEIAADCSPERDVTQNETSAQLQRALMTLGPEYRIVLILRHFHDLSYREMADVLGIPEKRVKSRLFTGRQLLRGSLLEQGYTP